MLLRENRIAWVDILEGGVGCASYGGKMMYFDTYSE